MAIDNSQKFFYPVFMDINTSNLHHNPNKKQVPLLFEKRNWKIYFTWIDGKNYDELAEEFGLARSTIKEICHSLLPEKVKGNLYLSQSAYKKFREWYRSKRSHCPEVSDNGQTVISEANGIDRLMNH